MPATTAAAILSVTGALMLAGRIVLGTAADSTGTKPVFIFCFTLSTCALVLISLVQAHWAFFALAAMIGFCQGGVGSSQSPLIASLFGLKSHGLIFGFLGFGATFGAAVGLLLTGFWFDWTGSYESALVMCAAASLISLVLAFFINSGLERRPVECESR